MRRSSLGQMVSGSPATLNAAAAAALKEASATWMPCCLGRASSWRARIERTPFCASIFYVRFFFYLSVFLPLFSQVEATAFVLVVIRYPHFPNQPEATTPCASSLKR
jgi:hypothetical protein